MAPIAPEHDPIRTPRLLLRSLRPEDADALFEVRNSPGATDYIPRPPDKSPATALTWIHTRLASPTSYMYGIEPLDPTLGPPGRLIGGLGAARTPEIGFTLHSSVRGKGVASEALAAFLPVFWEHVEGRWDCCVAFTDARNAKSRALLERAGFRCVGYERNEYGGVEGETAGYWLQRPGTVGRGDEWEVLMGLHEVSVSEFREANRGGGGGVEEKGNGEEDGDDEAK